MLKKHFFTTAIFSFLLIPLFSQISHQAVFLHSTSEHYVQDTIEVLYANRLERNDKKWIDCVIKEKNYNRRRKFAEGRLTFLSEPTTFWSKKYFWNQKLPDKLVSGRVSTYANQREHFPHVEHHDKLHLFKDMILEDYLKKKLTEVFTKEDEALFQLRPYIKIVKQELPINMALKSGCLLFSTGLLAQVYTEDELCGLLASEVAHLLFNHLTESIEGDANQKVRDRYSLSELILADEMAIAWLTSKGKNPDALGYLIDRIRKNQFFLKENLTSDIDFHKINMARHSPHLINRLNAMKFDYLHGEIVDIPDPIMELRMVELIELHAYEMKDLKQYDRSLSLINRLIKLEIVDAEHYMTKVRLLKKLYPDGEKDEIILSQLRMAREVNPLVDQQIYEEEIRMLIRFEKVEEAILLLNDLDKTLKDTEFSNQIPGISIWSKDMRKRLTRALREKELIQQKDIQRKG